MSSPGRRDDLIEGMYARLASLGALTEQIAAQQREQIDEVVVGLRGIRRSLLYATFGFLAMALVLFVVAAVVVAVVQ